MLGNKEVTIVNYNTGNIFNVIRAVKHCGINAKVTDNPKEIENSERLILPGVGAFGYCIDQLKKKALFEALSIFLTKKRPTLGICVGMQILLENSSEFGFTEGLGAIKGKVDNIKTNYKSIEKTPVFGWYKINIQNNSNFSRKLTEFENQYFYFIHSYMAMPKHHENIYATYTIKEEKIPAIIGEDNIIACQFHPEKSGEAGLKFLSCCLEV